MPGLIGKQLIREDHPVDYFVATSGQTNFTLGRAPGSPNAILVFVNGVIQRAGTNYTLNGAVLTINSGAGLAAGSAVLVWYAGVVSGSAGLSGSIASTQATGSGDAQIASFVPAFVGYVQNMVIEVGAPALSVSSTPTINVDGLGVKRIYDNSGNDPVAGAVGGKHIYIYDSTLNGSAGGFRLINPLIINANPVGTVINMLGTSAPSGYLALDGSSILRSNYPALWSFAQSSGNVIAEASWSSGNQGAFSSGDLSTTFRVPDLRGEFLRGYDGGRGVDSGRTFGTNQTDAFQGHWHAFYSQGTAAGSGGGYAAIQSGPQTSRMPDAVQQAISDGTNGTPRVAIETRPRNIVVLFCVKY